MERMTAFKLPTDRLNDHYGGRVAAEVQRPPDGRIPNSAARCAVQPQASG